MLTQGDPLQIIGPYRDQCGYGGHIRRLACELIGRHYDLRLLRLGWNKLVPDDQVPPELLERDGLRKAKVVLHMCLPSQVSTACSPDAIHINHTMFEATPIPSSWVDRARSLPLTLVPTENIRRIWIESGVAEDRVGVSPLGVDAEMFRPDIAPLVIVDEAGRDVADSQHRFLSVVDPGMRENVLSLCRAWLIATQGRDDAVWIVKLSGSGEEIRRLAQRCQTMQSELNRRARIAVIAEWQSDETMARLFATATCYASASRGDGWDLPMFQAAATDLTLIAPYHTAYVDYLDDDVAVLALPRHFLFRWADEPRELSAVTAQLRRNKSVDNAPTNRRKRCHARRAATPRIYFREVVAPGGMRKRSS